MAGALFFANFLSLHDAGYFDLHADVKPLLHLWSLGVEEQFYLLGPIALLWIQLQRFVLKICVV